VKPGAQAVKSVLVTCEPSRRGEAALSYALDLARSNGATLTVTSVAPQEPTDAGCASCRASALNEQLRLLAHERLSQAANAIGDSTGIRYLAACGPKRQVLAQAARHYEAHVIVLPWQRAERLRRHIPISTANRLSQQRPWEVLIAPRRHKPLHDGATLQAGRQTERPSHSEASASASIAP
jgi:nucleotide-binding universal stress UspA family protein